MTEQEIWDLVPLEYKEVINERGLKNDYINAIITMNLIISNGEETHRRNVSSKHKNFAAFMSSAFLWNTSPQGFKWWFKNVLGEKFIHPCPDDTSNYGRYTNETLKQAINNYKHF